MAGGGGDGAAAAKPALGVIFLGHVDSGKSTLIGHLMLKQGAVDAKCVGFLTHLHKHRTCAMHCNHSLTQIATRVGFAAEALRGHTYAMPGVLGHVAGYSACCVLATVGHTWAQFRHSTNVVGTAHTSKQENEPPTEPATVLARSLTPHYTTLHYTTPRIARTGARSLHTPPQND
jgi:hypothetical protein